MAIIDSRVKDGVLTLGTTPRGLLVPGDEHPDQLVRTTTTGTAVETLCGDQIAPGRKLGSRSLAGTFIQDWTGADVGHRLLLDA